VGAIALAEQIEASPLDAAVLDQLEPALARAYDRTLNVTAAEIAEGEEWMRHWKEVHPQFNTVDY
jgi:hypothetical protein